LLEGEIYSRVFKKYILALKSVFMIKNFYHINYKYNFYLFIILMLLCFTRTGKAQTVDSSFDTKGTDFWLTFPPNFHNWVSSNDPSTEFDDSLYIFITSEEPTSGVIEYTDLNGGIHSQNFSIADPTKMYIFSLYYLDYELMGYNNSGIFGDRANSEVITRMYFHVTSDKEVTVYAHDQAVMTSDACLVFPTDILGNEYFIISYKSDGSYASYGLDGSSTPSEFVILATEDNTNVTIIPSDETEYNGIITQYITLNKGDAYLVQAGITEFNLNSDLTGSEVISDKPIAIFAGHQRANIPINPDGSTSRDYLLEEMPPIETWGKNALLVPYVQPPSINPFGTDLFRILAANDNTQVFINGSLKATLNKGKFYEGALTQAGNITANAPILVSQFKKTSGFSSGAQASPPSDPFEMLIPPVEQFMISYRIINVQAYEYSTLSRNYVKVYSLQYVAIVAPDTALQSVLLDGANVPINNFIPIPTSNYDYANIRVNDGVHTISCNAKVGVYVYGYGAANSYGYVGGMSMKPIDFSPPQVASFDSCYSMRGFIYDSLPGYSHVKSVLSPPDSQVNVIVTIDPFTPYPKAVGFNAMLQNFYQDGEFVLVATDSAGLYSTNKIQIPGFTLSVMGFNDASILPVMDKLNKVGKIICLPFVIENYGKHPQTIDRLILNDTGIVSINYQTPKTLVPSETDTVWVCFSSAMDTVIIDTISVVEDCGVRKIQALDLTFKSDVKKPEMQMAADPCNKGATLSFSDSTEIDLGLEKVDILDTVNCSITVDEHLPQYETLKINVIDPYKDAIYHIMATDSAGLTTEFADTIQGFTIGFPELTAGNQSIDFGNIVIGNLACDTLKITNTGILPITFDSNIRLGENIIFSLPASQIPFTLNPGETEDIRICFSPLIADSTMSLDTLNFDFNCLTMRIAIGGTGDPIIQDVNSKCNVPVRFTINELPSNVFLNQNEPNPVASLTTIRFGIAEEGITSIKIFDLFGNERATVFSESLKPGVYELNPDINKLEDGVYLYLLSNGKDVLTRTMIIRR
jgi:hypothetical protein